MLIRALVQINGGLGTFPVGTMAEIVDSVATAWIEAGAAELVTPEPDAADVGPIEEAVISPPETAVQRRGRKR